MLLKGKKQHLCCLSQFFSNSFEPITQFQESLPEEYRLKMLVKYKCCENR